MPRKPKPGPRQNRGDLPPVTAPGGPAQAPTSYTGGEYGSRKANLDAQAAAPMADRSTEAMLAGAAGGAGGAGAAAGPAGPPPDSLSAFLAAAQQVAPPDEGGLLAAPTARPDEPLSSGLSVGAGPGPEALPLMPEGPDPSVILWAPMLPALEVLASQPGSSPEVRQFYRRIRSQISPDYYTRTET